MRISVVEKKNQIYDLYNFPADKASTRLSVSSSACLSNESTTGLIVFPVGAVMCVFDATNIG